jgi:hypothetical protein
MINFWLFKNKLMTAKIVANRSIFGSGLSSTKHP